MRREWKRRWRVRKSRRELWVMACSWKNPFRECWRYVAGRCTYYGGSYRPWALVFKTRHGQQTTCYCRTGATTELRLELFGCALIATLSRDLTQRPCSCDKLMMLMFPDGREDEIEAAGGLPALQSEFPGVGPM